VSIGTGPAEAAMNSRTRRSTIRALVITGLLVSMVLAGCGGDPASASPAAQLPTAVTPAPTPTLAATPPAVATASPTAEATPAASDLPSPGSFAFDAAAVFDYYIGEGYACGDASPSSQAEGYLIRRCQLEAGALTIIFGIVSDEDGTIGNAFMGVLGSDGVTMPSPRDAIDPLAGFLGAMLGQDIGTTTMSWLAERLGEENAETQANGLLAATYAVTDDTGAGLYVELASQAFMDAPVPGAG
jgi:hypothetical protein